MRRKFFGSESSLQRQFIASGLTGVFALGAVGSSYAGAMDSLLTSEVSFFQKHKVAVITISVLLVVVVVVILLFTVILPALKSEDAGADKQGGQKNDETQKPSGHTDSQEGSKDQKPSDNQGKKGNEGVKKALLAGEIAAGTLVVGGGGALAASKLLGKGNGNEATTTLSTEKLRNEDDVSGLSDVETEAESEDEGMKRGDNLKENDVKEDEVNVENKGSGEVGE